MYGALCRQCYEDKMRREARDAYDQDGDVLQKRKMKKDQCKAHGLAAMRRVRD